MRKTMMIIFLLATASFSQVFAVEVVPKRRTTLPELTFEQVLKKIAFEIEGCKRLHGVMTRVASATMRGNMLDIKGEANRASIDVHPMKMTPTPEQLKSLIGKPICDPN